jgi:CRISPR/Cas system-associated exonuclease Cas4 (RecB family)
MSGYLEAPPKVWPAIKHALATPALAEKAQLLWAKQAQHLFKPHKVELSASSAGACVLERWAYLHGQLDIPEDYETRVLKMDGGTMYGCWIAALFTAGWESKYTDHGVAVEVIGEHDGIPGHVEIVIFEGDTALWVVEIKTSYFGGAFNGSRAGHILQAAKEALIVNAPGFSVLNVMPAATKNRSTGAKAQYFAQEDFVTADHELAVQVEYQRLQRATEATPPTGDAREAWRCNFCQYSKCERNTNESKPKEGALRTV